MACGEDGDVVKTIFLDLDNTLLDFDRAEAAALSKALERAGITPTADVLERYHELNAQHWKMLEDGVLTRDQVLTGRFAALFAELGISASPQEICDCYEHLLAQEPPRLLPGARELLEDLAPRFGVYLASNGASAVQRIRLRNADLTQYFRGIFISEEMGIDKPKREFFQMCFAAIPDFSRQTALMVGDSLTSDIRGGRNAGIRTCWYNPDRRTAPPGWEPDEEIARLAELPALLQRL